MQNQLETIIEILRRIPEKKLLIIELANQIPIRYGNFDLEALSHLQTEIKLAKSEAEEYAKHTVQAVEQIIRIPGDTETIRLRNLNVEEFVEGFEF